jgi:hypothetical protein
VATGPRPLCSWASITVPLALRVGIGAQFKNLGLQLDGFEQFLDTDPLLGRGFAKDGLPPQASGIRPKSLSSRLTRSGSALSLSILLTATTIGTSAAFEWAMASLV